MEFLGIDWTDLDAVTALHDEIAELEPGAPALGREDGINALAVLKTQLEEQTGG